MKGINFVKNLIGTQADFQKKALDATLADLSDRSVSISQKIAELQESGKMDEKTLAPLIQQRDAIKTQIAGILTADVAFQKQLALEQAKKTGSLPTEASLAASAAAGDPVATKALELLQQGKGQGFQDVGVAEKGGNVIVFDPRSAKNYVTTPQGERTVYDPAVHGKILSRTMPQSVVINLQGQGGFSALPKDQQEQWYEQYTLTGQVPPFARGDAQGRNQFIKGWADFQAKKGSDPGDAAATRTSYKALGTSLSSQEKSRGMMGSFVRNLNEQIDKVKEIQQNRIGIRLLDLPVRELAMRAKGSGEEAVLASYLMEISREIGKLSTGSQASIAELSVAAQEKWDKIHDPNLSFKELSKVLQATKDQARMRLRAADEEINYTKRKIKGLSGKSDTSPDRVRVKSPNGSIGTIPVGQLNDALSQGYKRVD